MRFYADRRSIVLRLLMAIALMMPLLLLASCGRETDVRANKADLTLTGYIIDEHCFVKKPEPELDSKMCLQMEGCAASGYGIAVPLEDGSFKFYYFDGSYPPNADGGQKLAVSLIDKTKKTDHILIEVKGNAGDERLSAEGISYDSIKVSEMSESEEPAA